MDRVERAVASNDCDALRALQAEGVDITAPYDSHGQTPLMLAARSGTEETIQFLLKAGADVDASSSGVTALMLAATSKEPGEPYMALLMAGADVNAKASVGTTALCVAVSRSNVQFVRRLLQFGAEVDAKNEAGRTSLCIAALKGPDKPTRSGLKIMKMLVDAGADINPDNETPPLMQVLLDSLIGRDLRRANYDPAEATALLVASGANVNVVHGGITPLMMAAQGCRGSMQFLIKNGAEVNTTSTVGTAYLWKRGYDIIIPVCLDANDQSREESFNRYNRDLATVELHGFTALDIARTRGDDQSVQILLRGLNRHIAAALSVLMEALADVHLCGKILEHWLGVPTNVIAPKPPKAAVLVEAVNYAADNAEASTGVETPFSKRASIIFAEPIRPELIAEVQGCFNAEEVEMFLKMMWKDLPEIEKAPFLAQAQAEAEAEEEDMANHQGGVMDNSVGKPFSEPKEKAGTIRASHISLITIVFFIFGMLHGAS